MKSSDADQVSFDRWRELFTIAKKRKLTADEREEFRRLTGDVKRLVKDASR